MEKKISCKLFFTILFNGIWQAICWFFGLFKLKDQSWYGKLIKRVIWGCLAILCLTVTVAAIYGVMDEYRPFSRTRSDSAYEKSNMSERQLGNFFTYVAFYEECRPGYVIDNRTGEKVLEDIVWLVEPQDGDSLVVYKNNKEKRGYFNRYTGEVQLAPQYEKAWIFSEGLASVMLDGEVYFIDHNGNKAFDLTFPYPYKDGGYCFHGGYCAVENADGMTGIIDKSGNWVLEPKYESIEHMDNKYWIINDGKHTGIADESFNFILPVEYEHVYFDDDFGKGIYAIKDGVKKLYDYNGKVLADFIVYGVYNLTYATGETDYNEEPIKEKSNCLMYFVGAGYCGLMDMNGKPLTKAIYNDIEAINENTFLCRIDRENAVVLNQYGKPMTLAN